MCYLLHMELKTNYMEIKPFLRQVVSQQRSSSLS